ncbi:MAG: PEP-CTERM sorting domain-containing protein [Candidatus Accumulibacter sp.]|nr:PEP-CTERM sorting domain-containing protein [Accumulibacter sp.]
MASASTITIDGNLADWGIDKTNWKPADSSVNYTIEDQVGSGSYFLSPGWGGQAYDAEAIYAKISQADQKLYIALATGHNPRTLNQPSANSFGAGDFAIDFGKDGRFDLGINIKHALSVQNGVYTFESFGVEGGVYSNPTWEYGLWTSAGAYTPTGSAAYNPDRLHPTHLLAGTYRGMASLAYTTTPATGYGSRPGDGHYFYEMSVDLALLTRSGWNGQAFDIHWTENCANDSIWVDPPGSVPEPGSLTLAALALAGLLGSRRKTSRAGR